MNRPALTPPTGPRTWAETLAALYREWHDRTRDERAAAIEAARELLAIVRARRAQSEERR